MSAPNVVAATTRQMTAVVVSTGLMAKTVKARVGLQQWNNVIEKKYNRTQNLLVHDPASSLRVGDIISISPGWRYSKHVHHVVNHIVAPFGVPIESRPAVPTLEERVAAIEGKRKAKQERRTARQAEKTRHGEEEGGKK